jgi:hypothetical protein
MLNLKKKKKNCGALTSHGGHKTKTQRNQLVLWTLVLVRNLHFTHIVTGCLAPDQGTIIVPSFTNQNL